MSSSSRELKVVVRDGGDLSFIYDDALASLCNLGAEVVVTTRASNVEPAPMAGNGVVPTTSGWIADMAPSGGPVLRRPDGTPFLTRQEALQAEHEWLSEHLGL